MLTSYSEGFSNAIIEYMLAGLPVVATDVGGAAEAVSDGISGFLVNSDDHQKLAARLIELLKNNDRAKLFGQVGRQHAIDKFSCQTQLNSVKAVYAECLGTRGRSI